MYKYTAKRILLMVPTLIGAAILVFILLRLIPGDVCELRLAGSGTYVDPQAILDCQQRLGISEPKWKHFIDL
jgi:peptide/nickel transport system permease protein